MVIVVVAEMTACATHEAEVPDAELDPAFPEVKKITIQGNNQFSRGKLLDAMATKPRPLLKPWKRGDPYNPSTLDADMLRLRKFYFDRGFLNTTAQVTSIQKNAQENFVEVEIEIEEGQATKVGSVRIESDWPDELPPKHSVITKLSLGAGDRLNKEDFDESRSSLLRIAQDNGYARARVSPDTEVDSDTNDAHIVFRLDPGDLTAFGQTTIKGAETVPEYVIRRQLDLPEGQIYSTTTLSENRRSVYDLGMFSSVTPRALNLEEANTPLDVEFEVNERKTRTGRLGVGASSIESMRYEAEWVHRNLLGEAERLSLLARMSGIQQGLEAELREPYFLSRDNSLTYTLFALNNETMATDPTGILDSTFSIVDPQPAYDLFTFGATARLDHRFTDRFSGATGLELTNNNFYNVDRSTVEEEELEGIEDNKLFVQFGQLEWNGRDNDLDPTRGELVRIRLSHSNEELLSDDNFAKLILEGRYYVPLFDKVVLATRLKLGGIQPYSNTKDRDIPVNVRFYAGGPGSVRGFKLNRLGPLNTKDDPIGGNSLIEGSVELRMPLSGDFSGALFVDFGEVFSSSFSYQLDDLRYAVGTGIRYITPIGPLRVDIGFALDRRNNEDFARPDFSIGQAF